MTDAEQLKPCPFCGEDTISQHEQECEGAETYYWFRCETCGGEIEGEHGLHAAIACWNRRLNPSGDADVREAVARVIDPDAFKSKDQVHVYYWLGQPKLQEAALAKADAILALTGNASTDRAGEGRIKALEAGLRKLMRGYVSLLETGRDRIVSAGGDCDSVDVMEAGDPYLREVRSLLNKDGGAG